MIKEKIKEILNFNGIEIINDNEEKIELDSLQFISIILDIEEEFKICVDDSDLNYSNFKTIDDYVLYIEHKVSEGSGSFE